MPDNINISTANRVFRRANSNKLSTSDWDNGRLLEMATADFSASLDNSDTHVVAFTGRHLHVPVLAAISGCVSLLEPPGSLGTLFESVLINSPRFAGKIL